MKVPLLLVLLAGAALAEEPLQPADERRGVAFSDRQVLDGEALDHLPATGSISNVMSRVFLSPLFSLEESMGFSDLEHERMSVIGNSALWTQWRLETLNLTDPFFDGAAAFKVPFLFLTEIEQLNAESARHEFGGGARLGVSPRAGRPTRAAQVSFGVGGVGDTIPFAEQISDFITTAHTRSRAVQPAPERRRFLGRLQAGLMDTEQLGRFTVRSAVEVDGQARRHVDFPLPDRAQPGVPYTERGLRVSAITELAPEDRAWRVLALGEYRQRDHLFAERRYGRSETMGLQSGGALLGVMTDSLRAGLTFKHDRLTPVVPGFSRELYDLDGEGLFPFVPAGAMNSLRLDLGYRAFSFYASSDTRLLAWSGAPTRAHALTWEGAPAGSVTLESRPTTTIVGSQRVGYLRSWTHGNFELSVDGYAVLNHAHAAGARDGLVFPDLGAEVLAVLQVRPWFQPFLSIGKTPISVSTQNALAVTPGYSSATQRRADGRVMQTLGADFASIDPALRGASTYSVVFGVTSRFLEKWKVSLQGIARAWHSMPRFVFDGAPEDFGHFNGDVFFLDGPSTRFRLVNDPFNETPYGGMVQLEVARLRDENGFFNASFSAANFFGHPPSGNGPFGNDIGLIDQLGANPNDRYRSFSYTDADRAFILKVGAGKRWWRTLWTSIAIFFKDGQPFAYYDPHFLDGQLALRRNSNRGSPLQIHSPLLGWREDYQIEVDLRVSYDFELTAGWHLRAAAVCANCLDLGNEVSERHWAPYDRSALEMQLPRSLNLSLQLLEVPRARRPDTAAASPVTGP